MTPITIFKKRKVAIFGLGTSGLAAAAALKAGEADVILWDDHTERIQVAYEQGYNCIDLRKLDFSHIAALILAPGVPLTNPSPHWSVDLAHAAGVEVIGDIELFCRQRNIDVPCSPFIAITGTNGKSTTTALVAHILQNSGHPVEMGGNIGHAILDMAPPHIGRYHVIECSSYQIDLAPSLNPSIGVHLNLSPDHLDRHGTFNHYAEIKGRLIKGSDAAVVGVDDRFSAHIADEVEKTGKPLIRIGIRTPVTSGIMAHKSLLLEVSDGGSRTLFDLAHADHLRGPHNAQNAAAAFAVCRFVGLSDEEIISGLKSFPGLAHRMETVAVSGRIRFVNDSKASNADAVEYALLSYNRIYWIAGGIAKQGGIESLQDHFPRIAKAYLIGEAQEQFAKTLDGLVSYKICKNLKAAVRAASKDAQTDPAKDITVLLSPACASFDQFANFEVRGEAFRKAVSAVLQLDKNNKGDVNEVKPRG